MLSVPTLLPALLGATLAQPPQQPNQAVLEVIPLQHVCASTPMIIPPLWHTAMTQPYSGEEDWLDLLGVAEQSPQFDVSSIVDFMHNFNEELFSENEIGLDAGGDCIIALGDSRSISSLREQIRELSQIVTRPITVEVTFWHANGDLPRKTVLSPEEYAAFASSHEAAWRRMATTRTSRPVSLDSSRWSRYVRDVNVEIASKSAILCPQTDAFFEGGNIVVVPHGLVGGDEFAAHVQFAWAKRMGPVQRITTGIPDSAQLDAAAVASVCGGFSGRLTNGGALCAAMTGVDSAGTSVILTVRLTSRTPPVAAKAIKVGVYPISALSSGALTDRIGPPPVSADVDDPREIEISVNESESGFGQIDADRLTNLLHNSLGDEEEFSLQTGGGHLFVQGSEEAVGRVESLVRALQDRMLRTASIEHVVNLTGKDDEPGTVLHRLMVPTLLGRYATVTRRAESNLIGRLGVEVAEDASAIDPVVNLLQFGSWMRARIVDHDNDAHLAMLTQSSHCELPEPRQMVPAGSLNLTEIASQRIAHDGAVVSGQPIAHGDGPTVDINGRKHRSTVITTVYW